MNNRADNRGLPTLSPTILSIATGSMFSYNDNRNFAAVMCNPNGRGYVVTATNIAKGETMVVSNVIETIEQAYDRAKRFAGHVDPVDHDAIEQYLSERLGF